MQLQWLIHRGRKSAPVMIVEAFFRFLACAFSSQKFHTFFVLIVSLSCGMSAQALTLGELRVKSYLDQPLLATIPIQLSAGEEAQSVSIEVPSRDDLQRFGIEYRPYLRDLVFTVTNNSVEVTSGDRIINEPFIKIMLRVRWPGGQFLREYTALIDPPVYANQQASAAAPRQQAQQEQRGRDATASYGPVRRGDTLGLVAKRLQNIYPDLDYYAIVQTMYNSNPQAFAGGNINRLIVGSTLNVDDIDRIREVDVAQARRFFKQQSDTYRSQFGSSNIVRSGSRTSSRSNITTDAQEEVVEDTSESAGRDLILELENQVSNLQTALDSVGLENQSLRVTITALQEQLRDNVSQLLELEAQNRERAVREQTVAQNPLAQSGVGEDVIERVNEISNVRRPPVTQESQPVINVNDESTLDRVLDFFAGVLGSVRALLGSALSAVGSAIYYVAGLLVVLLLAVLWWRRRSTDTEFESSVMSEDSYEDDLADSIPAVSATAPEEESSVKVEDTTMNNPTIVRSDASNFDSVNMDSSFFSVYNEADAVALAGEVDPIAEADVYIAYGRDNQAEEVLKAVLKDDPKRTDVRLKLIQLYHKAERESDFESQAEELYSNRDSIEDEAWQEIQKQGLAMGLTNPIFSDESANTDSAARHDSVVVIDDESSDTYPGVDGGDTEGVDGGDTETAVAQEESEQLATIEDEVKSDEISEELAVSDELEEISSLNKSQSMIADGESEEDMPSLSQEQEAKDIEMIDELESALQDVESSFSDSSIDELTSEVEIFSEEYSESQTQFELAQAFVDLGDNEAAKPILQEILDDETQKNEDILTKARKLLDSIS